MSAQFQRYRPINQPMPDYVRANAHDTAQIKYLWIGCIDNHVLPTTLMGIPNHEVLVYKNLAHQINHTDLNCLSMLQYAFQILGVKKVIVCGHYDCNLLESEAQSPALELIESWLHPLYQTRQKYHHHLQVFQSPALRRHKLCELNVIEQVIQLARTTVVQSRWQQHQKLTLQGLVYAPDDNVVHDLAIDIAAEADIMPAYRTAVLNSIGIF